MPTKKLTGYDIRPGVVYVVQRDRPYGSTFMKGDRVVLVDKPASNPSVSCEFKHEDGKHVPGPYLRAEDLAYAIPADGKPAKKLTRKDIQPGVVYVLLEDQPDGSTFMKGDRVKLSTARDARPLEFVREDGRTVAVPFVTSKYLAFADQKEATMPALKPLTDADLREGQIYVVLTDRPSCSGFLKGERVMMKPGTKPREHYFQCENGRQVGCPFVAPEFLEFADGGAVVKEAGPVFRRALMTDLKPGAVFKVEGMRGYHGFPVGSIVQHTGEFTESAHPRMQLLTLDGGGLKQYVHLQDMSVVTEGKGAAVAPKPVRGSGKVVKTATRSDAHTFELRDCGAEGYMLQAGCRWFTMAEAAKHWRETRIGTDLGHETFDILYLFNKHIDRLNAAKKKGA